MMTITDTLSCIRRPRLLIRAARHGVEDYNRNRDLKRILRGDTLPGPATALPRLIDLEAAQEETRASGQASYSVARHLEILIALMGEARLLGVRKSQA
jgi:hypothetical protein